MHLRRRDTLARHVDHAQRDIGIEDDILARVRNWKVATDMDCLFCKIVRGEAKSKKVYEDERAIAFEDIRPQAPTHVLVIPKKHIIDVKNAKPEDEADIGHLHIIAAKIARERGIEDGYRTVFNVGPRAGQSVFHLHLHLIGGRDLRWPPG